MDGELASHANGTGASKKYLVFARKDLTNQMEGNNKNHENGMQLPPRRCHMPI